MKLIKDNIIRNLVGEDEIKIFKDAGWIEVQDTNAYKENKEEIKEDTEKVDYKKNKIK